MDLDKLRKAKQEKEKNLAQDREERLQKEKELKAKQKTVIQDILDKIFKITPESSIQSIKNEDIDETLSKNIFADSNNESWYMLPITIELDLLTINITINKDTINGGFTAKDGIKDRLIKVNFFNDTILTVPLNEGLYYYREYTLDTKKDTRPAEISDTFKDDNTTDWLSDALKEANVKYVTRFDIDGADDFAAYIETSDIFNPYDRNAITDALIKKLEDYGLYIIEYSIDENENASSDKYILEYRFKFKNPLI